VKHDEVSMIGRLGTEIRNPGGFLYILRLFTELFVNERSLKIIKERALK